MPEALKKNKMQIVLPMQMILGVVDQLLATKTQAEFDQVIQTIMQTFAPQGPGGPQGPGAPPAGGAAPAANPFGQ
jgi:hypothetical protein